MACDVKVQVKIYNPETKSIQVQQKTIKKGIDKQITFNDVVDYILQLPKSDRVKLAAQLRAAKVQPITESDIKNHHFISNITLDGLKEKYPDLKQAFPEISLSIEDNPTLIFCSKMKINGSSYYGRTISPEGNEIFFINGYYGAQHLFKYLDTKNKIDNAIENGKLKEQFSKHQKNINILQEKYNLSIRELLTEFLNNKSKFIPFTLNEKIINSPKIINDLLYDISGDYNPDNGKTDLQISLESIRSKSDNNFEWKLSYNKLYDVLSMYFQNIPDKEKFMQLDSKDMSQLLSDLFINDPKLMRAKVKTITGGNISTSQTEAKTVKVTQAAIKDQWNKLKEQFKSQGIELQSLTKLLKDSPNQAINFLQQAFQNGITDKFGNTYTNLNIQIVEGKPLITYTQLPLVIEKQSSKYVTLSFPWASVGELYNFGYKSKYLFSPVSLEEDSSLDQNGMYQGVYLYKYFNPKTNTTHYAISRNIISPDAYMHTFPTLDSAKRQIEQWNKTQKINEWGLWSIKENDGKPRTSKIESGNISEGQILTVIDYSLPSVKIQNMPQVFKDAFNGTLPEFYNIFSKVDNIQALNTPEKAAAFILSFYNQLKTNEKQNIRDKNYRALSEIIQDNKEIASKIISDINNSSKISYQIEALNGNIATLKYLSDGGTNVQINGKYSDNKAANQPTVSSMNSAVDYFNKAFGLNIKTLSRSTLKTFNDDNNLGLEDKLDSVRAFVYNGNIYINSSNANLSDLFHEMSHIFLGLLKVKYPEAYQNIIQRYTNSNQFVRNFRYIDKTYNNFSQQDKVEETVVDIIAKQMFNKQSLVNSLKGEEFVNDFQSILTKFPELATEVQKSGLEFTGFMQNLMSKENMSEVKRNMKISQLVRQFIKNGKIKEIC